MLPPPTTKHLNLKMCLWLVLNVRLVEYRNHLEDSWHISGNVYDEINELRRLIKHGWPVMNARGIILQAECPGERGEIHLQRTFFLSVCPSFHDENWPNPTYSMGHNVCKINTCLFKVVFLKSFTNRHKKKLLLWRYFTWPNRNIWYLNF